MKCAYECPCEDESADCTYEYCEYCPNDATRRGYCTKHYFRLYRAGELPEVEVVEETEEEPTERTYTILYCSREECDGIARRKGLCDYHYMQDYHRNRKNNL